MEIILGRLMIIATVFLPVLFASAFFVYGALALWERVRGKDGAGKAGDGAA